MGLKHTPLQRIRQLQIDWAVGGTTELAKLLHTDLARLESWLASTPEQDDGSVPVGLEGVWRLLKVRDCLEPKIPQAEKQVDWLFAARKDWDGARPIDLLSGSLEEASWLAYWLDSVTQQPASETPTPAAN